MKDLYLTSTFTNPWNVKFNQIIGDALEQNGLSCYLPYRDTNQSAPANEKFDSDMKMIKDSKIILAIAINESPNFGAEIGFMYGLQRPIITLTDKKHQIPLICEGMMTEVFRVENLDKIEEYIDSLVEKLRTFL